MSAVENPGGVSTGNKAERSIAEENKEGQTDRWASINAIHLGRKRNIAKVRRVGVIRHRQTPSFRF